MYIETCIFYDQLALILLHELMENVKFQKRQQCSNDTVTSFLSLF